MIYADDQAENNPNAVGWWDAVDVIGMDAYPTLTAKAHPTANDFQAGWTRYLGVLREIAGRWHKKLILTEIGYRSVDGGAQNPWDWQRQGPVDLEVQALAYLAGLQNVSGREWLAGMYWWQWSPDPADGGAADTGYTPRGKPAERILTAYYKDDARWLKRRKPDSIRPPKALGYFTPNAFYQNRLKEHHKPTCH